MKTFFKTILLFLIISLIYSQTSTHKEYLGKKFKACSELVRARIRQDEKSFEKVLQHLSPEAEENEKSTQFMMILLADCVNKIKEDFVDDLLMFAQYSEVDSLKRENKILVPVEKWGKLYLKGNQTEIDEEAKKLSETILEINSIFSPKKTNNTKDEM